MASSYSPRRHASSVTRGIKKTYHRPWESNNNNIYTFEPCFYMDGETPVISPGNESGVPVLYTIGPSGKKTHGIVYFDDNGNYLLQTKIRGLSSMPINGHFGNLSQGYMDALMKLYEEKPECVDFVYCSKGLSEADMRLLTQVRSSPDGSFSKRASSMKITNEFTKQTLETIIKNNPQQVITKSN